MNKKRKPSPELLHIRQILPDVLTSFAKPADEALRLIWKHWNSTVGSYVAENAHPVSFKDGLLVIKVPSSAWLHHLQFMKSDIMGKLNALLEGTNVRDVKLKIGPT